MPVNLDSLIAPTLEMLGLTLYGIEQTQSQRHCLLRVYVEKEGGVSIENCEQASRQIAAVLDVNDPISCAYTLEVSSPGLERPLFLPAHYAAQKGEPIKVTLRVPRQGRRHFAGVLESADDAGCQVLCGEKLETFSFAEIAKAQRMFILKKGLKKSRGGK